jgi:hypothetical protein
VKEEFVALLTEQLVVTLPNAVLAFVKMVIVVAWVAGQIVTEIQPLVK